jgi:hypothetical protein
MVTVKRHWMGVKHVAVQQAEDFVFSYWTRINSIGTGFYVRISSAANVIAFQQNMSCIKLLKV